MKSAGPLRPGRLAPLLAASLLAVATVAAVAPAPAAPAPGCRDFGKGIEVVRRDDGKRWTGDFNGDGVPDELYFLRLGDGSSPGPGVTALDPWSRDAAKFSPGASALGISHGGKGGKPCRLFVLSHPAFLDSPVWQPPGPLPLSVVKRKDAAVAADPKLFRGMRGDALLLGTEAGPDVALIWTGKSYVVRWPSDEP